MQPASLDKPRIGFVKQEDRDGDGMYVGINKTYTTCAIRSD